MNLSVFYDHVLQASEQSGMSIRNVLRFVKQCGIDAVEIRLCHTEYDNAIVRLLEEEDLKISCIYEFYDMGFHDESNMIKKHLGTAKELGVQNAMLVPGFLRNISIANLNAAMKDMDRLSEIFDSSDEISRILYGMEGAANLGADEGITVLFENFDDYSSPMSGINGVLWFLQRLPDIKMVFDCGNFIMYHEDVISVLEQVLSRIGHVHCKDRMK